MELKHLISFIAVAECESFIQAATQLHVSQPAVTAQIQRLEQDLGVQLLDRNRRRIKLTAAGAAFLSGAYATLKAAEEATQAARAAAAEQGGRLRLGFPPSVSRQLLPRVLNEMHRRHPQAKMQLFSQHTSITISSLHQDTLDVGFVRLPVEANGLEVIPIHQEPLSLCLPAMHPLCSQKEINIADLHDEQFIMYGRKWAPGFHDRLMMMCQQAGFTPSISVEIDEMYNAPALVAAGEGISILPSMVITNLPESVAVRTLWGASAYSEIGIVARSDQRSPLVRSLIAISRTAGKHLSSTAEHRHLTIS